jgi:hypothetical protein
MAKKRKAKKTKIKRKRTAKKNKEWSTPKVNKWLPPKGDVLIERPPYKSGPSKVWLKIKNPNAPAATRAMDGTLSAATRGLMVTGRLGFGPTRPIVT